MSILSTAGKLINPVLHTVLPKTSVKSNAPVYGGIQPTVPVIKQPTNLVGMQLPTYNKASPVKAAPGLAPSSTGDEMSAASGPPPRGPPVSATVAQNNYINAMQKPAELAKTQAAQVAAQPNTTDTKAENYQPSPGVFPNWKLGSVTQPNGTTASVPLNPTGGVSQNVATNLVNPARVQAGLPLLDNAQINGGVPGGTNNTTPDNSAALDKQASDQWADTLAQYQKQGEGINTQSYADEANNARRNAEMNAQSGGGMGGSFAGGQAQVQLGGMQQRQQAQQAYQKQGLEMKMAHLDQLIKRAEASNDRNLQRELQAEADKTALTLKTMDTTSATNASSIAAHSAADMARDDRESSLGYRLTH